MADDATDNPMTPSGDYQAMVAYWDMVKAILGGAETMRALSSALTRSYSVPGPKQPVAQLRDLNRGASTFPMSPYLPCFPNESQADYEMRRKHAPFTNIRQDIADNLASKPFRKEFTVDDATAEDLKTVSDNIDGQGRSMHRFGADAFRAGLDYGISYILIDYTKVPEGATLADERAMNARPYWVLIEAPRMLAVYSTFFGGQEVIVHARIHEPTVKRIGYGEECVNRVREFSRDIVLDETGNVADIGPATWALWEEQESEDGSGNKTVAWVALGGGSITIGEIPLVAFAPNGRVGMSWRVIPPFRDIDHLQVELFQQESNLKTIKELAAFPMLTGNGVTPPVDASGQQQVVPLGPRGVLFAPMGGEGRFGNWQFIEPQATSMTFLQSDSEKLRDEMRDLGRQPMASANLTVITTANVAMKASSTVEKWAIVFEDAIEQAWGFTCKWLARSDKVAVNIHRDYDVDFEAGTELDALLKAQAAGIISKNCVADELQRRGVLADSYDWEEDQEQMAGELDSENLNPEKMIDPVTGKPLVVTPTHGVPNPPPPPKPGPSKPTVN